MADRIEKQIVIRAPRAKVWSAIANKSDFGKWFGVRYEGGPFASGEKVTGKITYPGYEHMDMEIEVVEVVPEERLSYRWHPYAVDPAHDYSSEPATLVTFTLEDAEGGTLLKIVESGFDRIPLQRRAEAWTMNEQGWAGQITNIDRYVTARA